MMPSVVGHQFVHRLACCQHISHALNSMGANTAHLAYHTIQQLAGIVTGTY